MQQATWIWLAQGLGYAAGNALAVLQAFDGNVDALYAHVNSPALQSLLTPAQAKRLLGSVPQDYAQLVESLPAKDISLLCYGDDNYPSLLRHIDSAPPVLYIKGRAALLSQRLTIGIVGARRPSAYGVDVVRALGKDLARSGAVIISGLAAGLDAEAHKAALSVEGDTVACIAFGHDHCYPAANRPLMDIIQRHGAVISEYPPYQRPDKPFFLQRNRLIAALSAGLLVAEAREYSGTMSTVNCAVEYGRDVFAAPGSIFSPLSKGTHAMIREGAYIAASAEDILSVYDVPLVPEEVGSKPIPATYRPRAWQSVESSGQSSIYRATRYVPTQQQVGAWAADRTGAKPIPKQRSSTKKPHVMPTVALDIDISAQARQVLSALGAQPVGLTAICESTGLATGATMAALTELELAGLSRQLAGRQFVAE